MDNNGLSAADVKLNLCFPNKLNTPRLCDGVYIKQEYNHDSE